MMNEEEVVLELCMTPRTRWQIAKELGMTRVAVTKVIRKLERKGLIVSRGLTAARKHMTLAAAIVILFEKVGQLSRKND